MSATVLYMSMSLDGVIAGTNEGPGNGRHQHAPAGQQSQHRLDRLYLGRQRRRLCRRQLLPGLRVDDCEEVGEAGAGSGRVVGGNRGLDAVHLGRQSVPGRHARHGRQQARKRRSDIDIADRHQAVA